MKINGMITGCLCGVSFMAVTVSCRSSENKPNILFILADDQRADALGCAGNQIIKTPNIDKLAGSGMRFTNSYVMGGHHGAISAPSRAMLMSGKYLFNVYDKLMNVKTMPMHFAEQGYVTFGTGKWHNEKGAFEKSFQRASNVFLGGMADHFNIPVADMGPDGKLGTPVKKGFSTDVFAGSAIDFIKSYASGDRKAPFFCYVAFTVPHDPYSPRTDYINRYDPDSIPLPGNYMPLHPFKFDDPLVRDENLLPWPRPEEKVKELLADYYGLITHLDSRIGDIIKELKESGLYDNTIIVYAADNGLAAGSHGLLGKQNLYEHSMKVPLIITGPGIPEGKISDALVYLFDLYPTLSELSHLPAPQNIDGKSLVTVLSGKSGGVRESLFTAYRNTIRAVRTKEWKLIRYPERNYIQLFNLVSDPLEMNNLAIHTEYIAKAAELLKLMSEWQVTVNDTIPLTAPEILPLQYDHTLLVRKPDQWQPEYTLKKYFGK
jgi:arylsulfatase A-like enzyme